MSIKENYMVKKTNKYSESMESNKQIFEEKEEDKYTFQKKI